MLHIFVSNAPSDILTLSPMGFYPKFKISDKRQKSSVSLLVIWNVLAFDPVF